MNESKTQVLINEIFSMMFIIISIIYKTNDNLILLIGFKSALIDLCFEEK